MGGRFFSVTCGAIVVLCDCVCAVERAEHLARDTLNGAAADATLSSNLHSFEPANDGTLGDYLRLAVQAR
jgi:hypothetical protein